MPAILKRHVEPAGIETRPIEASAALAAELRRLAAFLNERADELDGDILLTVQEAAQLAGRTDEAVRVWIRKHGIGVYDPVARRHMIRKSHLVAYVLESQGVLPAGLRAENLSAPKSKTA
jgi:hypothetical protein